MKFDFHFGEKKTTLIDFAVISFLLDLAKHLAIKFLKVTEDDFMFFVDELNRNFFHNKKLNDYVLADETWLEMRIERDVDTAIDDYLSLTGEQMEVIIEPPIYSEELEGETLLGGELRLTAPYKKDYEL